MENLLSIIGTIVWFVVAWLIYLYYNRYDGLDEHRSQRLLAWMLGFFWIAVGVSGNYNEVFNGMFGYGENNR